MDPRDRGHRAIIQMQSTAGQRVDPRVLIPRPETRLYAVQAEGCAPMVRAWTSGSESAAEWMDARTEAWGLRVPRARGDRLILRALAETGGGAISVSDASMERDMEALQRTEGINACIEGGAVLAAARLLRGSGQIAEGETVVLFNTGNLQNY